MLHPAAKRSPWLAILGCLVISISASADVVSLKDGSKLEGDVKKTDGGYVVTAADGTVTRVETSKVQSIRLGKTDAPDPKLAGNDRLASLRRSVESLSDLKQIIERYRSFIEMNKGAPAAADAQKDLAMWQDRLDRGLVKVSGKWITQDERAELISNAVEVVAQARDFLKANRLREAEPLLQQAVELDPKNAAAWYLSGVLYYRQDKIPQARRAFESANAAFPGDPATLNNLGVVLWRQNQFPGALNFYDQAMLALPANKEILNNVAEALASKKEDVKRNAIAAKVTKRFAEQDAQLQAMMAQYGWYRWGSSWVDQSQMDRLKQAEQEIKDKLAALQKQFDSTKVKISENQRKIGENERFMQDIESRSYNVDSSGKPYRVPYPESYYNVQRDNEQLVQENKALESSLAQMQQTAKRVQQQLPTPKYTGVQHLIDVEGMPRTDGSPPETTQPAAPVSRSPGAIPVTQPTTQPATQGSTY
jgi:Flp pilus assembly protein TadD